MALSGLGCALLAPLFVLTTDGSPMRLGLCVSASAIKNGLSLAGRGVMQWRRLPVGGADAKRVWIEVGVVAPRGKVRLVSGGVGPCPSGRGPAYVFTRQERQLDVGMETVERWQWVDGSLDERIRLVFDGRTERMGEVYLGGEGLTRQTGGLSHRARAWFCDGQMMARRCGLLPMDRFQGNATRSIQRHLRSCVHQLQEMAGQRGQGDFQRGNDEVTNLEFDTILALIRCAIGLQDEHAWLMAQRSMRHFLDRDLDRRTGLPFRHGLRHRSVAPDPGHVWLQGLLWVALLTADDAALVTACEVAHALALQSPVAKGRFERARDYAWPLLEMEALLTFHSTMRLTAAANRHAAAIAGRFDPLANTFRFGEGELGGEVYLERAWLTAGLVIPALKAHLRRVQSVKIRASIQAVEDALMKQIGRGSRGMPTHWRITNGRVHAVHYERAAARGAWLVEPFGLREQRRIFGNSAVRRTMAKTPSLKHADLATEFTKMARCVWVWR
jgi:hypothetical protein